LIGKKSVGQAGRNDPHQQQNKLNPDVSVHVSFPLTDVHDAVSSMTRRGTYSIYRLLVKPSLSKFFLGLFWPEEQAGEGC
jgi:hypothetical protein